MTLMQIDRDDFEAVFNILDKDRRADAASTAPSQHRFHASALVRCVSRRLRAECVTTIAQRREAEGGDSWDAFLLTTPSVALPGPLHENPTPGAQPLAGLIISLVAGLQIAPTPESTPAIALSATLGAEP